MEPEELKGLREQGRLEEIRNRLNEVDAYALVDLFSYLDRADLPLSFRLLSKDRAIEVFEALDVDDQLKLVEHLGDPETVALIEGLDPDDRAHLFAELPAKVTKRLLTGLSPQSRAAINLILGYPEDSAGRFMTPRYIAVRTTNSVGEVLVNLHTSPLRPDEMDMIFVIDPHRIYRGYVRLGGLIKANPSEKLETLAQDPEVAVHTTDPRTKAAEIIADRDLPALAVVDGEGRLVGSVTFDDILDVVEEEVTDDFQKMAPIGSLKVRVRDAGIVLLYQKRMPWLLFLVFINVFTGAGIAFFQATIESTLALIFFLPLLIAGAGNAGSQSATLMIRSIATDEVRLRDWLSLVIKEMAVAILLGVTLALAVALLGIYRGGTVLALVVAITMLLVVIIGSVIGMSLPFLMTRLNMDPATASSPLITSIADIMGVAIYFSIATALLKP